MQITLRSHLIAGTAAVVGAGAIAMTPVTAAHLNLPSVQVPSMAQVALAGFDSPLSELLSTAMLAGDYVFNNSQSPTDPANWPFSGIATGTGLAAFVWPNPALGTPEAGGYSAVGLVPQIIDDALPIISRLGYNGSTYLEATIGGLGGAALTLSEGVWNAAGDLITLQIPAAIQTLVAAVQQAGALALDTGLFVATNVVANASSLAKYLISEVPLLAGTTFKQVQVLVAALVQPIKNVIGAFGQPKPIEGVFNAVVDGLLGPSGIPGTALNLTIGAGVQTGPISGNTLPEVQASIAKNFVPSVRTEVQAAVKGVANALPLPSAATVKAGAASRSAKAAAAVEAPSVSGANAAVTSDAPEASAPAKASASKHAGKHRAARGAAARGAAS